MYEASIFEPSFLANNLWRRRNPFLREMGKAKSLVSRDNIPWMDVGVETKQHLLVRGDQKD